jgi:hypothetical protein
MAVTGEIQIGRISRFLTKWLGAKGPSPRMTIGGEIVPVLPLWSGVENRFLDSWNLFAVNISVLAGGAGNTSATRLRNAAGSGVIAVVERILVSTPAADFPFVFYNTTSVTTDLTTTKAPLSIDFRQVSGASLLFSSKNNSAASGSGFIYLQGATGPTLNMEVILDDNQEIVLPPGSGIDIASNNLNQALNVSMRWRERAIEDSEKS